MNINNKEILNIENIKVDLDKENYIDAIKRCGQMLVDAGYVNEKYIEGMLKREEVCSTAIGNYIAIPHGENEYKKEIKKTGLCVCTYPKGIDWNGTKVRLVIGIASSGDEHIEILENIAINLGECDIKKLVKHADANKILDALYEEK